MTKLLAKLLATTTKSAHALGCGRTKLFELLRDGELHAVKLGGKTLIPVTELERLAASLPPRIPRLERLATAPASRTRRFALPSSRAPNPQEAERRSQDYYEW